MPHSVSGAPLAKDWSCSLLCATDDNGYWLEPQWNWPYHLHLVFKSHLSFPTRLTANSPVPPFMACLKLTLPEGLISPDYFDDKNSVRVHASLKNEYPRLKSYAKAKCNYLHSTIFCMQRFPQSGTESPSGLSSPAILSVGKIPGRGMCPFTLIG